LKDKQLNAFEQALLDDGKIKGKQYAHHLYCAINNCGIYDLKDNLVTDYGQRGCAGMIAHLRNVEGEDYLNFAWDNTKDDVSYIHQDLQRLGFKVGEHPSWRPDYQYKHPHWVKLQTPKEKRYQIEVEGHSVFVSKSSFDEWLLHLRPQDKPKFVTWSFAGEEDSIHHTEPL
jgi:hypothetical protein